MFTQTFSLQAFWIFALCNELITSYYRHISNRLNRDQKEFNKRDELFYIMKCWKSIEKAHDALNNGFSFTLMTATCFSFIELLASYHNVIDNLLLDKKIWSFFLWDLFDSTDFFLRLVLVCYMADRAHSAGIIFINN